MKPTPLRRTLFFLVFDIGLSLSTLYLAYNLRFNFQIEEQYLEKFLFVFGVLLALKVSTMWYFKMYHISWRFISLLDVKKLFYAHAIAYGVFLIIFYLYSDIFSPFPRSILIIDLFLSLVFIGTLRISKRLIVEKGGNTQLKQTLLVGVSPFAQTLLKQQDTFYISAVVDDSPMTVDSYFSNIQVHGLDEIEVLVNQDNIEAAIIAKTIEPELLKMIYSRLQTIGVYEIKVVTLEDHEARLKEVSVEDLLARHPKDLDLPLIEKFIKNKSILITGAGGSIGSQIAKQCSMFGASTLVLVDSSEYNLYQIGEDVSQATLKLLSVTDKERLKDLFEEIKPQIVIHAAAYKHVPICESNQEMAVLNNVLGTKNVIDVSIDNNVEKVVVISTDKAVRPINIMGATKRVTELYANNVESKGTEIVAVRFGNVLGSSGSVIPKFKQQIEEGGPVTVTHPDITRYFMLIPEACQLVLQTAAIAKGGELFILDMGEPIKILDLAKQMIRLYGKENEIEISFSGLRPGEKLYEELLLDESEKETKYRSIFIAQPTAYDMTKLNTDIGLLLSGKDKVKALQEIVPEFNHIANVR